MQFTCAKTELIGAIGTVQRAASKMQKTILECVLFECEGDTLTLKATDLALSIKTSIKVSAEKEGSAAVPTRVLYEIINRFPETDIIFKKESDNTVEISCLNSKVDLQLMNADEFPMLPEIDRGEQLKMPQNLLKAMINQTIFSAATADDKPILTGLLFDITKDFLTVVALDGYRMSVRREQVICDMERKCVVPARALRELSRILGDTEENIKIAVSGNMALFEAGDTQVYTRLLEGEFVNYVNLLPKECATRVKVETAMLESSLERASVLAREGSNNVIKFTIEDRVLGVSSNSEMGRIDESIPVLTEGNDLKIAFNAKYILDVLKNIEENEVVLQLNTNISPCVIKTDAGDSCEYLVLPVQMRE